jgi:hypothetical protein
VTAALLDRGYVRGDKSIDQRSGDIVVDMLEVTPDGLQQVGGWPGGADEAAVSRLMVALDSAIEHAEDGTEQQTKLQRLRQSLGEVSRQTVAEIMAKVIAGQV